MISAKSFAKEKVDELSNLKQYTLLNQVFFPKVRRCDPNIPFVILCERSLIWKSKIVGNLLY